MRTQDQIIKDESWTRPEYYLGPDYPNTISVVGRSRDSDIYEKSNFEVALEMLGGESKTVQVIRDSHWACGWVETIRVDLKDEKSLKIAIKIIQELDGYPVLDEDHFCEMEREYIESWADEHKYWLAKKLAKTFKLKIKTSTSLLKLAYELEVDHQWNNGVDSSLDATNLNQIKNAFENCLEDKAIKINNLTKLIAKKLDIKLKENES